MVSDFLSKIILRKQAMNAEKEAYYTTLKETLSTNEYTRYKLFQKQISKKGKVNLIAEIKKASPSRGMIREQFDLYEIARAYVEAGADAISILTEDKYFLGSSEYVKEVQERFNLPVLTKDFIISEGQIYEARYLGASAVLLIASLLDQGTIRRFIDIAASLDLDCLVEVHDKAELDRVLDCGAEIIGINNRNLKTFEVDLEVCRQLIPKIPKDKVIVAESGIKTHEDIVMLKDLGANAVLIGEAFMAENNILSKIKEIMG